MESVCVYNHQFTTQDRVKWVIASLLLFHFKFRLVIAAKKCIVSKKKLFAKNHRKWLVIAAG